MEYILIFILQIIGISLSVLHKVWELDKVSQTDSLPQVFSVFWKNDRVTVFISLAILVLNLVGHYILMTYTNLHETIEYFQLYGFGLALVLGYAGQRIIYKYLGSAEKFLDKKVGDKLN